MSFHQFDEYVYFDTWHINESVWVLVQQVKASRFETLWAVLPRNVCILNVLRHSHLISSTTRGSQSVISSVY
jgi:hypothetical protein